MICRRLERDGMIKVRFMSLVHYSNSVLTLCSWRVSISNLNYINSFCMDFNERDIC